MDFACFSVFGAVGGPLGDVGAVIVEQEARGLIFGRERIGSEGKPRGKGQLGIELSAGSRIAREEEGAVGGIERSVESAGLTGRRLRFFTSTAGGEQEEGKGKKSEQEEGEALHE